jgi:pimeloyl-ACP methyl ester carboxylesterase
MSLDDTTSARPRARWRLSRPGRALSAGLVTLVASLFITSAGVQAAAPDGAESRTDSGFQHGYVSTATGPLHYVKTGSGPVLVLLHGWPQTWYEWHEVMPRLAANHTLIAFDLPGLGSSSIPAAGSSYLKSAIAARIREGVRNLGYTGQVGLVGHDLGTLIAYAYARDFPNDVSRILVSETPLAGYGLEAVYGISWHLLFNASPAPLPETIMDNADVPAYLGMIFDFTHRPETVDRPYYYNAYSSPARRTAGYEYYRAFAADGVENQALAPTRPVHDPIVAMGGQYSMGPGVAASFAQVATDVRQVISPDAAHFIPEENPVFMADCVKLFFGPAGVAAPRPELAGCVA